MGGRPRLPPGPLRCGNSMPTASVSRPLPGNWASVAPQCDDALAKLQCKCPTRTWQEISGYRRLAGGLTVNFPPITPGAPLYTRHPLPSTVPSATANPMGLRGLRRAPGQQIVDGALLPGALAAQGRDLGRVQPVGHGLQAQPCRFPGVELRQDRGLLA